MRALFTWPISDEYKQKFIDTGVDCVFNVNYTKEDIDNADVVFGNPNPEYLKNSHIKWLQLASAGACIFRMNKAGMKLASVPAILFNDATSTVFSTTSVS